eukprot:gene18620-28712_t
MMNAFEVLANRKFQKREKKENKPPKPPSPQSKRKAPSASRRPKPQPYDYYMVIDFEATCERDRSDYPHEIIEFPVVVVHAAERRVVDEFHSFVRPVKNPVLTAFCKELTGISQAQVDGAPVLDEVVGLLHEWLDSSGYLGKKFVLATDGPWDFREFFWKHAVGNQAAVHRHYAYYKEWVNIRKMFSLKHGQYVGVAKMLGLLGMRFEGREHSGRDDTRNIARILIRLLSDGCVPKNTERVDDDVFSGHLLRLSTLRPRKPAVPPSHDLYFVVAFHATCAAAKQDAEHPPEIIDLPVAVVDAQRRTVVDSFHSFVRPVVNRTLTDLCTTATGVTQDQVDAAPVLDDALGSLHEWMEEKGYLGRKFVFVADGPRAFRDVFWKHAVGGQAAVSRPCEFFNEWVNLRQLFSSVHGGEYVGLAQMLETLGLRYEGDARTGENNALSMAKVLIHLIDSGAAPADTERVSETALSAHHQRLSQLAEKPCASSPRTCSAPGAD